MTYCIGIAGPQASGKDTLATLLQTKIMEYHPKVSICITHLADPVRKVAAIMTGDSRFLVPDLDRDVKASSYNICGTTRSGREVLQLVGTEMGRDILGENVWIEDLLDRTSIGFDVLIVPDVRFPNEYDVLCDTLFYVSGQIPKDSHRSESYQDYLKSKASLVLESQQNKIFSNASALYQFIKQLKFGSK